MEMGENADVPPGFTECVITGKRDGDVETDASALHDDPGRILSDQFSGNGSDHTLVSFTRWSGRLQEGSSPSFSGRFLNPADGTSAPVAMAQRGGQRIRGVLRNPRRFQLQELAHHPLNLAFSRTAAPEYGHFDFPRRVLRDADAALDRGEQNHAPGMTEPEGGFGVARDVGFFDGNRIGQGAVDQFQNRIMNPLEPPGKRLVLGHPDFAVIDVLAPPRVHFDESIAHDLGAGIDA